MTDATAERSITSGITGVPVLARLFAARRAWMLTAGGMFAVLAAPLFLTDVPPLLDYPNHLARLFVLARPGDPVLSRIYAPHWSLIPNIAIDVIGPALMKVLPVYVAGRLLVALALFLPVAGVTVYARAVAGTLSYWPLASGLVAYNALFLMGFLNLQIAPGLVFFAAALWRRGGDSGPRTIIQVAIIAVATFFAHVMGVAFLVLLLGADELAHLPGTLQRGRSVSRVLALATVLAPPALLYSMSSLSSVSGETHWLGAGEKFADTLQPFMNYASKLDAFTGMLAVVFVYLALRNRWATAVTAPAIALAFAVIAYGVAPHTFKDGSYFDTRFLIFGAFLLFAILVPVRMPAAAGIVFGIVFLARMSLVAISWHGHASDVAELRETIAGVPAGSRVLAVAAGPASAPDYWNRMGLRGRGIAGFRRTEAHMAGMLVIERRAFWPLLFSDPSQQPIEVLPPYDRIAVHSGEVPEYTLLAKKELTASQRREFPYLEEWEHRFDFVLVLDAGGVPDIAHLLPGRLRLAHATDMAALFRIQPRGGASQ